MGAAAGRCVLDQVGERVARALDRVAPDAASAAPIVMVVAPGGAAHGCADRIAAALPDVAQVVALRTDRTRPGSTAARWETVLGDATRPAGAAPGATTTLVVVDVQWADPASLAAIAELAARAAAGVNDAPRVVAIRRMGDATSEVAELELLARRHGRIITVEVDDVDVLVARGFGTERAVELVAATDGAPDLVELLDALGSLDDEIATRLAVVGPDARRCAELLAFGADGGALDRFADVLGGRDGVGVALDQLTVEGILVDGSMPAAVVSAVRASCPPTRRAEVVAILADRSPPSQRTAIADVLVALDDRSAATGLLLVERANALTPVDAARAGRFVEQAMRCGVAAASVAGPAALVALAHGDPLAALRSLHAAEGPAIELVRAAAWAAAGDPAAAAQALRRSDRPVLAAWACIGEHGGEHADDAASAFVRALAAWVRGRDGDGDRVLAELGRVAMLVRAEPGAVVWPVSPDAVGALVARRLGEPDVAQRLIAAAVADRPCGELHHATHRLLAAWLDARRGLLDAAARAVDDLSDARLAPRDRFVRAAARCAIALRDPDATDLAASVGEAIAAADDVARDVYDLDLVTEVAAAASRARSGWARDPFTVHAAIVAQLGDPARLRRDVAWARLRAAMAGDDASAVARAADAAVAELEPATDPVSSAALTVARVLRDPTSASPDEVVAAAQRLAELSDPFEAARVCGIVATASTDERVARALLKESRRWRASRTALRRTAGGNHAVARLSEQEVRVGRMVVDGFTHKQIGAALFCSPKTVEHHVAHIRTKLGAANRAEMITALRDYLASDTSDMSATSSMPS